MFSISAFFFVLSVLVMIHEFGHFIAAKRQGVRVEKFSFGFGPKLFGIRKGDTEYVISLILLGGYVKMAGDEPALAKGEGFEFLSKTVWQRFKIIFFGPLLNYVLGFLLFWLIFFVGFSELDASNKVGSVLDGAPAKAIGIKPGDRIIAVDGKETKYWKEIIDIIHPKKEGTLKIVIKREPGKILEMEITPRRSEVNMLGKKITISQIGIGQSDETVLTKKIKYNLMGSFINAGKQTYQLTAITYKVFFLIATGKMSMKESVTGPIGIFIITNKVAQLGLIYLLQMMAVFSISLAIFNLLPVPVLDGGHILFLIIEKIRGRPLNTKAQDMATHVGMALLIALMVFVFYSDIIRFVLKK